jgi:thiamine biosynthesis lipoprotein
VSGVSDAAYIHTAQLMGTAVQIEVVGHDADDDQRADRRRAVERAIEWFRHVEETCTRFDPASELMQLSQHVGAPVAASDLLFEAVRFAVALAEDSGGAFDPTVGRRMEVRGFDREYRTGHVVRTERATTAASYRDIELDTANRTITLVQPLVIDLGAVAKGLAIDMAARELRPYENFVIDAGGDLYLAGHNASGERWRIGIRHPRDEHALIETLRVSDAAVCTSGDYERRAVSDTGKAGHHIIDARSGETAADVASVTVVAPLAMVADGLATAAFALGPARGIELLERHGVSGVVITPSLERYTTRDA